MKKYVFLTFAVSGIGGTQIYVRNKLLFLKHYNWDVSVICTEPGHNVCVKELLPFEDCVVPQLMSNPYIFNKKQRGEVIRKLRSFIGAVDNENEIVIESNFVQVNLWGEILAKEIKAKHFVYLIQEDYSLSDMRYMKFYDFKYRRGELAGNTEYALSQLFDGYRKIPEDKTGELIAVCYNTIEECESEHDKFIKETDFHIGSIGRINKPFVDYMIQDIIKFANKHCEKSIQLVMFGGSPDNDDIQRIYSSVADIRNLDVYITGAIFPVPKHLLDKMDVFISSAGAARTSSDAGYITITIDANDFEPIGILGYTTNDNVHRNPELPHEKTATLLDEILIERKYDNIQPKVALSSPDYMEVFKTHMQYLSESTDIKEYYNVAKLKPRLITRLSYRLLGQNHAGTVFGKIKGLLKK